jgi:hypothetical protein
MWPFTKRDKPVLVSYRVARLAAYTGLHWVCKLKNSRGDEWTACDPDGWPVTFRTADEANEWGHVTVNGD